jgi:hypothetical protein
MELVGTVPFRGGVMSLPDAAAGSTVDAVPALFAALVDDAGLFPPERLPMDAAVARHRADEAAGHPVLTQRFLCPASMLGGLRQRLGPDERWRIGLITDIALDDLRGMLIVLDADPRLTLETIELRLPPGKPGQAVERVLAAVGERDGTTTCVELSPAATGWEDALAAVADRGLWAKVRCGGLEAAAFPTTAQLAAFLRATAAADVAFKATAGLHHALRYHDAATGFDHHGFLNLLLATCRAVDAGDADEVEAALAIENSRELADQARAVSPGSAQRARSRFRAYGSCSTSEPIEDLAELGLIGNGEQQ